MMYSPLARGQVQQRITRTTSQLTFASDYQSFILFLPLSLSRLLFIDAAVLADAQGNLESSTRVSVSLWSRTRRWFGLGWKNKRSRA